MIDNTNITHKPDRHIEGGFFQDTIYSLDKKLITQMEANGEKINATTGLFKKTSLTGLMANTEAATRTNIEKIISDQTRNLVLNAFDERIASGVNWKLALTVPVYNPINQNHITRVRVSASPKGNTISKNGQVYISAGYAYLDVWSETVISKNKPKQEIKFDLVTLFDANQKRSEQLKLLNDRKRFFIGDTVYDKKTKTVGVIKKFQMRGPKLFLQHISDIDETAKLGEVSGKRLFDLELIENVRTPNSDI